MFLFESLCPGHTYMGDWQPKDWQKISAENHTTETTQYIYTKTWSKSRKTTKSLTMNNVVGVSFNFGFFLSLFLKRGFWEVFFHEYAGHHAQNKSLQQFFFRAHPKALFCNLCMLLFSLYFYRLYICCSGTASLQQLFAMRHTSLCKNAKLWNFLQNLL